MLLVICVLLAVGFGVLSHRLFENDVSESLGIISCCFSAICGIIVIGTLVVGVVGFVVKGATVEANKEIYKSLTYQLENEIYDSDTGIGKKELYDQIQDWNKDLAEMKAYQRDFWIGILIPNIYDDFEFIEFPDRVRGD